MQMKEIVLELPFPPSVNHYWRSVNGRVLISKDGREYRKAVYKEVINQIQGLRIAGGVWFASPVRADVSIIAYMPDNRRRDLDNLLKASLDAIVSAGVIEDDSHIDRLKIERGEVIKGGKLVVFINSM